jgi:outer membrane lipoprotein-sorting protein
MPNGNIVAIVLSMICLPTNAPAQGITPGEILKEVTATYESLQTYKATGNIVADIDTGNAKMSTETSFSILLMKPNRYLVSWTQKNMPMAGMAQGGAVWSDGSQPYLCMGKAYSKMSNDEFALASATGISGGAAFTIPSLFFKGRSAPFARLKDLKVEKTEQVGEEDCYVISGASTAAKKETFWISKSSHLIVKYARSLEPNQEDAVRPDMTDEQLDEAIKGVGQEVTEESRKNMRQMMNRSQALLKNMKIRGSSTETHAKISSPDLSKTDFQFVLPSDAVMKDSLFDGILRGGK